MSLNWRFSPRRSCYWRIWFCFSGKKIFRAELIPSFHPGLWNSSNFSSSARRVFSAPIVSVRAICSWHNAIFFRRKPERLFGRRITRARVADGRRATADCFIHISFQSAPRRHVTGTIEIARPLRSRLDRRRDRPFRAAGFLRQTHFRKTGTGSRRNDRAFRDGNGLRRTAPGARAYGRWQAAGSRLRCFTADLDLVTGSPCCASENRRRTCCASCR